MGRHLLEGNQAVQHNELDIVVTFLHNQLNIALRRSLGGGEKRDRKEERGREREGRGEGRRERERRRKSCLYTFIPSSYSPSFLPGHWMLR